MYPGLPIPEWHQNGFKLYQGGMSDVDVARNTGIKRTTFIRYRKKYKIKRK